MKDANQSANADKKKSGRSKVSTFRYYNGYCFVTLKNGVQGIIGNSTDMALSAMLSLKNADVEIEYQQKDDVDGYERYQLGFAL